MASHLKNLSFFFLVLLFSSVQTEARVSKFFSKFTHSDTNVSEPASSLPTAPAPAPESVPPELSPAPALFSDESQNAYGLFGSDSHDRITDLEEEILAEDSAVESHESGYRKPSSHGENYGNGYYQYQRNYDGNGYEGNYRGNGYETTERQGMSDTRFLENGKYNGGGNGERNGGGNGGRNEESYFNGYGSEKQGSFNGGDEYSNEFDSMEEFENQEYQKSQEFVP